jgi:hypothetical protein
MRFKGSEGGKIGDGQALRPHRARGACRVPHRLDALNGMPM